MRPKLYIYPHVRPTLHDQTPGFENAIPMTRCGIAGHFDVVTDPGAADYFWAGQIADRESWMLHPNRFPYFKGNESRTIFDLEGDWRDFDHPEWLSEAVIVTGHVRIDEFGRDRSKFKRRFARPVVSPLLLRLASQERYEEPWAERGFWFQGQMDFTKRYREKLNFAFQMAQVPGEYRINSSWALYADPEDELVKSYQAKARKWSYALCPIGEGPTCRLYEMALMERIPILIADYRPFGPNPNLIVRWSAEWPVEKLAESMRELMDHGSGSFDLALQDQVRWYAIELRRYFSDPTGYLLEWMREKSK